MVGLRLTRRVAAAALARVSAAMQAIAEDRAVQERFLRKGARDVGSTPEAALECAARERPMWQEMVRLTSARLD